VYGALEAAKAKWDRGFEDFKRLQLNTGRFVKSNPYRIAIEFEAETGWYVAYTRMVEQVPPLFSVLVGSISYQCLSALNLTAWELAARKIGRRKIEQVKDDIFFPMAKTGGDFKSLRLISKPYVSKQAVAGLRAVQPYSTQHGPRGPGQHPFFMIKTFADTDKHRVLAPMLGRVTIENVRFKWDRAVARNPTVEHWTSRTRIGGTPFIRDGAPLGRIRFEVGNTKAKVRVDRQPTAQVAFVAGRWVVGLDEIAQCLGTTMRSIRNLAPLFPRETDPWLDDPRFRGH
jgi:hypothetical protein